jgi:hypothetical protein
MLITVGVMYILEDWVYDIFYPVSVIKLADKRDSLFSKATNRMLLEIRLQIVLTFLLLMLVYLFRLSKKGPNLRNSSEVEFLMPDV